MRGKNGDNLIKKDGSYEYDSDFEGFVDDSSNDEGFASGRPTSMSDSINTDNTLMSQYTPRLETMLEEDEDTETIDDNKHEYNNYGEYGKSNISLYEEDVQAYLKSEALKDGQVLQQVEQSWMVFLQPYVCRNSQNSYI